MPAEMKTKSPFVTWIEAELARVHATMEEAQRKMDQAISRRNALQDARDKFLDITGS